MKRLCLSLILFGGCFAQPAPVPPIPDAAAAAPQDPSFPSRRTQREMMIKDDYKKNLRDSAELARLAEELKTDLEKGDKYTISVRSLKDADDIDKLARSIRSRLKRF